MNSDGKVGIRVIVLFIDLSVGAEGLKNDNFE
jgi:hypothetical protein